MKYKLVMPDDDPRSARVFWSEQKGDVTELCIAVDHDPPAQWQSIETAPKGGRELILLLTPSRVPQLAYSDTWWTCGFSVENKPTHWMSIPELPSNVEHNRRPQGVRVDGPVGPHTQEQ